MAAKRICSVTGCGKARKKQNFCVRHFEEFGVALLCTVSGCTKKQFSRGLCNAHLMRLRQYGCLELTREARARYIHNTLLHLQSEDCLAWPWPAHKSTGYNRFTMNGRTQHVHRYICEVVNGPAPSSDHQTAHRCGNEWCVNHRHLRWATPSENALDRGIHGTQTRGEDHHCSRFTEEEVLTIRAASGIISQRRLAEMYNVSRRSIECIIHRKTWAWLT